MAITLTGGSKPCPKCGERRSRCMDSRPSTEKAAMWKRSYRCGGCNHRFQTHEVVISEEGQQAITPQILVRMFLRDVERSARDIFGDNDTGNFRTSHGRLSTKGEQK